MTRNEQIASEISEAAAQYLTGDSRFGRDYTRFIPTFAGNDAAADRLTTERAYAEAHHLFVTPDNALIPFRRRAIADGKTLVLPSYGMYRGFILLEPTAVPAGHELYAAWLDGAEHFGRSLKLEELRALGPFDLIVAGTSAITTQGLRFGMGHRYLDVEWAIFMRLGIVRQDVPIAALAHDCQVADTRLTVNATDVLVDIIATPTRTLRATPALRPAAFDWHSLDASLARTPPLLELRALINSGVVSE